MTTSKKFAVNVAGALVVASMFSTSAFAQSRGQNDGWRNANGNGRGHQSESRVNVTGEGRVRQVQRENGGYRVQLDRGNDWYYVPQSALHGRSRNGRSLEINVGVNIRLGGYRDQRGYIYVSSADWLDDDYRYGDRDRDHDRGSITGVVTRIDRRSGELLLRDQRTGRTVNVEMRRRGRNSRGIDFSDLRKGDRVSFEGEWVNGRVFEAYRIDRLNSRR